MSRALSRVQKPVIMGQAELDRQGRHEWSAALDLLGGELGLFDPWGGSGHEGPGHFVTRMPEKVAPGAEDIRCPAEGLRRVAIGHLCHRRSERRLLLRLVFSAT